MPSRLAVRRCRCACGSRHRHGARPPTLGEVCLGRGPDAPIHVSHLNVSRHHAILRVDRKLSICDLTARTAPSSARAGLRLVPVGRTSNRGFILLGGEVTVLVHDGAPSDKAPLAMGPDAFRDQVEAQLREHERGGPPLAVCTVRCITTRKWIDVVGAALLRRDRFGMLTDSMACLLLVGRSPESAAQTAAAIEAQATQIRPAAASSASMNGPIASMS